MAIFMVKCPSCGSPTELNDEKEHCFCTECGMKILASEAELFVPSDEPAAEPVPEPMPAPAPEDPGFGFPETPPIPQLTLEPQIETEDTDISEEPPLPEKIPVYDGPPLNNAEQLDYLIMHQPQPLDSVIFHNSNECAAYANDLHALILDLSGRYARMNHAEEATCLDFLERSIGYCEYLDTRKLKFLAGTHEEKGKTVEDYGTYPVSKTLLKEIKDAREQFVSAYNGFFTPKIASAKAALEETKEKIKSLPGLTRFYHSFCTPLMGILTAAFFAIGLVPILLKKAELWFSINTVITFVGAILFIGWAVTSVLWLFRGGSARQLYKTAERQVGEVRTYRGKLKS